MVAQATETRPARLIAVGNRINVKAAATEASFVAELERIVGLAVPHLRLRPFLATFHSRSSRYLFRISR